MGFFFVVVFFNRNLFCCTSELPNVALHSDFTLQMCAFVCAGAERDQRGGRPPAAQVLPTQEAAAAGAAAGRQRVRGH